MQILVSRRFAVSPFRRLALSPFRRFAVSPFRRLGFVLLTLAFSSVAVAGSDRRAIVDKEVESLFPKLIEIRRDLHANPELSNREERTSRVIASRLKALGIPFEDHVAVHGVVARIAGAKAGQTIAVRADIDALPITEVNEVPYKSVNPGVKHGCGHDAHTTIGLATAEILWKHRSELAGTVYVIFQPAEEGPPPGEKGGAPLMIEEGLLERMKPQAMFALHVMPSHEAGIVSWTPGAEMASADRFEIKIRGKQTHGAAPHLGIDPIVIASQLVLALQTIASRRIDPIEPVVVTIGSFHSGTRFNIIPNEAELHGTLRTLSPSIREQAIDLIRSTSRDIAKAGSAEATVEFDLGLPVLKNDAALSEWGEGSLQKTLGVANVRRDPPRMIAEDFAVFAERVPSFYYFLGVGNRAKGITAALHTPDFDIDEASLAVGTRAMVNLVMDFLERPSRP